MGPLYVAGLIGLGARKSLQPIATRVALADYDQLHQCVAVISWEEAPLEAELGLIIATAAHGAACLGMR
jgi:hypothetical protein